MKNLKLAQLKFYGHKIRRQEYMRKKKAFTLIELLAVIVILAIILIIAVPKIADTIEKSKKGVIESSAKLIARYVEERYAAV